MGKRDSRDSRDSRDAVREGGAQECFLRRTLVRLADGREYSFRALPFARRTAPIIKVLVDDAVPDNEKIDALITAVELSMSYDQDEETIRRVMETGALRMPDDRVIRAMVAGGE